VSRFHKRFLQLCLTGVLLVPVLHADDQIDTLLNEYSRKNDLSQKTIDQNKGHLVLFTRDKLERMHARTLKDVMKMVPFVYYHENRYGLPDPLTSGAFEPYRSNFVRLFVDGVEITQGWLGSGVVLYGDMNIDFADHIEFYYMAPSLETSIEPAFLTIFVYSKETERDSGTQVDMSAGSRGYHAESINQGGMLDGTSYMLNLSHTKEKREKIPNGTSHPLRRDFDRTQLFGYVKNASQTFHLQLMQKNMDALAGYSFDATPQNANIDFQNVHMDYQLRFSEHLKAQFAYDTLYADVAMSDEYPLLFIGSLLGNSYHGRSRNTTYSAEMTYRTEWKDHRIAVGVKGRVKHLDYLKEKRTGAVPLVFDEEDILSIFVQDQYQLSDHELINIGLDYSNIYRNYNALKGDNLLQVRLGYLWSTQNWHYKTYLYRAMFALDPFSTALRLASFANVGKGSPNTVQTTWGLTQEVGYEGDHYSTDLMLFVLKDEEGLLQNGGNGKTQYVTTVFRYTYDFDRENSMDLQLYYAHYKDIFTLDKLEDYSGYLTFSNTYGKMNFYNGVIWHQNSIDHKNYFDLTSSVSWNINENLSLTLKGENILDKAKKTSLFRIDPASGQMMAPLQISPIDRRVVVELEYMF
jgi:iron complex outermembrane receptor protein